ncbi:hypothetical protein OH768_32850 [Streptomyces sp. NBC_01622]|nr:hypothetical protein OH768_32850 [Streptomyces sp. NBC_01622]
MEVGEGLRAQRLADPLLLVLLVPLPGLQGVHPAPDVTGGDGLRVADVLVPEEGDEVVAYFPAVVVPGADLHAGEGLHEVFGSRGEGGDGLVLAVLARLDEALARLDEALALDPPRRPVLSVGVHETLELLRIRLGVEDLGLRGAVPGTTLTPPDLMRGAAVPADALTSARHEGNAGPFFKIPAGRQRGPQRSKKRPPTRLSQVNGLS